jgi:hypothetical protein
MAMPIVGIFEWFETRIGWIRRPHHRRVISWHHEVTQWSFSSHSHICVGLLIFVWSENGHHGDGTKLPCFHRAFFCRLQAKYDQRSLSYHVPHPSQLNTQSSGLSLRTPSLLENPLTFFTNTRHPSQRYHLSFSTKKDCIFSHNTVVNIDVAPRLPVCHIIT